MINKKSFALLLLSGIGVSVLADPPKILNDPGTGCVVEGDHKKCKEYFDGGATPPADTTCPTNACSMADPTCRSPLGQVVDWAKQYSNWETEGKTYIPEPPRTTVHHVASPLPTGSVVCLVKKRCTCGEVGMGAMQCVTLVSVDFNENEILQNYELIEVPTCPGNGP